MDRNLGATTSTPALPTTFGLFYQWGRKDPFPASASVSSNVEPTLYNALGAGSTSYINKVLVSVANNLINSIQKPNTFYRGNNDSFDWYSNSSSTYNGALWGGASTTTPTSKTIFDPCPAGWRVPAFINNRSPWSVFTTTTFPWYNTSDWAIGYGRVYTAAGNTYYPAVGNRSYAYGNIGETGSSGYYFSATSRMTDSYTSFSLSFDNITDVRPERIVSRSSGFPIRCIKE